MTRDPSGRDAASRRAGADGRRSVAVAADADGSVDVSVRSSANSTTSRRLPLYASASPGIPIPIAVLARLAVDVDVHGRGIGVRLLGDTLTRVMAAAEQLAIRAVVVHAISDQAAAFYVRFGFKPLATAPRTLMIALDELRRSRRPR